jgi:hypothetical protein
MDNSLTFLEPLSSFMSRLKIVVLSLKVFTILRRLFKANVDFYSWGWHGV